VNEDLLIIAMGIGMFVLLPIVGLLLSHQRRMATIIHGEGQDQRALQARVDRLETELAVLRTAVADQALAIDDQADKLKLQT
jgi:hypothetical protein